MDIDREQLARDNEKLMARRAEVSNGKSPQPLSKSLSNVAPPKSVQLPASSEADPGPAWKPSKQDVEDHIAEQNLPTFSQLRTDHLDPEEKHVFGQAVQAAKDYLVELPKHPGVSLIMVAGPIEGDEDRTGFGCGKTMLANIIHQSNSQVMYASGWPESLTVMPKGFYYEAREVMAIFDGGDFRPQHTFEQFGNLIVIDDVGREGALRYEKRDAQTQAAEKQSRYYNIIDYCYEKKISLVVTSNMGSVELSQFLGGASWSRLLQMAPKRYRINMTGIRDMRPLLGETEVF